MLAVCVGQTANLAEIDIAYIAQHSKLPKTLKAVFDAEFDSPEDVALLPENAEVKRAVQLLINARAF